MNRLLTSVIYLFVLCCQVFADNDAVLLNLSQSRIQDLEKKMANKSIVWPRITPKSPYAKHAQAVYDAIIADAYNGQPSEEKIKVYTALATTFLKADGWTNRVLADTAIRLAIDNALRIICTPVHSNGLIERTRKRLPNEVLNPTISISDLLELRGSAVVPLQGENSTEAVRTVANLLKELDLSTVDELWRAEAAHRVSARDLLTQDKKIAFVARLAQTDIMLKCHLPLLESYLAQGGLVEKLRLDNAREYMTLMQPEPRFKCIWTSGIKISIEHIVSLLDCYRITDKPNHITRELLHAP